MTTRNKHFDVLIIGAGFSGLYMLIKARELGLSVKVIEAGGDVGGTWYWNRYPGARCDVESIEYSYEFDEELQQEWDWSERYATQPEILRYINHVAERFDLRSDIQFDTRVTGAHFNAEAHQWSVEMENGQTCTAQFLVAASGPLSVPLKPKFPGQDQFQGDIYYTGYWPHEGVDFTGQRVAVIGTGSSAVQSIPLIAEQADSLTVYQRTPAYVVPAHNRPLSTEERTSVKADYATLRTRAKEMHFALGAKYIQEETLMAEHSLEQRKSRLEKAWAVGGFIFLYAYADIMFDPATNHEVAEFIRGKIASVVKDPAIASILMSRGVVGSKRLCVGTNYYETYNRDNVSLVDINEFPLQGFTAVGIETPAGERPYDAIVSATGFDAMTGALTRIDIRGVNGDTLKQRWSEGADTYLGLQVSGFPNLFIVAAGPGSSTAFTNVIKSTEHHVEWIGDCIIHMRETGKHTVEAEPAAESAWVEHVQEVANTTLFPQEKSFYNGANVPGKARVYLPYVAGFPVYVQKCKDVASNGYEGFKLT
ncbi:MAG: NAD(P)/FAD-dependent oxidoreductase [Halioglobus sp.]